MRRRGGEVRNPRDKPRGFIGATDARRATARLGLRACHDIPPRQVAGYATAIPILSHQNHAGCFTFPRQTKTLFPQRGYGSKSFSPAYLGLGVQGPAQQSRWPSQRGMGPRAARTQAHKPQGNLDAQSSPNWANPRRIPMNGIPGFSLNCLVDKNRISQPYPRRVRNYPPGNSIRITRGLHPTGALARTLGQVKSPPG